jgi:serine/threonine protein kinase
MQVVSKHDYSKAADVYSFGIILWEMMTWRLPWDDLNPFQVNCYTRVGQTVVSANTLSTEALLDWYM